MFEIACATSASVGFGFSCNNAAAAMIWPDWQYPHCGTSCCSHATCTGWLSPSGDNPSIVVIFALVTEPAAIEQDRVTVPSICTEQAPHSAMPQPYLVPVKPIHSRITHGSGVSGSASTS